MFCPNCGANIPDDSEFCEVCGAKVNEEPVQESSGFEAQSGWDRQSAPAKKSSSSGIAGNSVKYIITAVIAVVVVALGIFVVYAMKHKDEEDVPLPGEQPYNWINSGPSDESDIIADGSVASDDVKTDTAQADKEEAKDAAASNVSNASTEKEASGSEATAVSEKDSQASQPAETSEATTASSEVTTASSDAVDLGSSSAAPITAPTEDVTLSTFDWFYNEGFPEDGTPLSTLKEICGTWNCMMTVTSMVSDGEQTRILLTKGQLSASDDSVKLVMTLEEKIDYYTDKPNDKNSEKPEKEVLLTYNGSWDELMGYVNLTSQNSDLGIQLRDYVEVSGKQYAVGKVYNGDIEIGDFVMVR